MEYSCSVFPLTMVKAWFFVEPAARSGIPLGCTDSARLLPFTISCIAFAVMMSEEVIREVFETPLGTNSTINWEQRKSAYNTHIDNLKRLRSKSATTFAALLERLEQEVLTLTKERKRDEQRSVKSRFSSKSRHKRAIEEVSGTGNCDQRGGKHRASGLSKIACTDPAMSDAAAAQCSHSLDEEFTNPVSAPSARSERPVTNPQKQTPSVRSGPSHSSNLDPPPPSVHFTASCHPNVHRPLGTHPTMNAPSQLPHVPAPGYYCPYPHYAFPQYPPGYFTPGNDSYNHGHSQPPHQAYAAPSHQVYGGHPQQTHTGVPPHQAYSAPPYPGYAGVPPHTYPGFYAPTNTAPPPFSHTSTSIDPVIDLTGDSENDSGCKQEEASPRPAKTSRAARRGH